MTMKISRLIALPLVLGLLSSFSIIHAQQKEPPKTVRRALSVAVIAPSLSTSREAKRVMAQQGWTQGKMKTADAILVVVRSSLSLPLRSSYDFIGELKEDAGRQINISGPKFHIYLCQLGDDLECTELKHISYEAE
jgi:hypothetical protein